MFIYFICTWICFYIKLSKVFSLFGLFNWLTVIKLMLCFMMPIIISANITPSHLFYSVCICASFYFILHLLWVYLLYSSQNWILYLYYCLTYYFLCLSLLFCSVSLWFIFSCYSFSKLFYWIFSGFVFILPLLITTEVLVFSSECCFIQSHEVWHVVLFIIFFPDTIKYILEFPFSQELVKRKCWNFHVVFWFFCLFQVLTHYSPWIYYF